MEKGTSADYRGFKIERFPTGGYMVHFDLRPRVYMTLDQAQHAVDKELR